MRIIPAAEETPKLSLVPSMPELAPVEDVKRLQEQIQAMKEEFKHWSQEWQGEFQRQISKLRQEISIQKLEERITALENRALATEVTVEKPSEPTPDRWLSELEKKESALKTLKAQLEKIPETAAPAESLPSSEAVEIFQESPMEKADAAPPAEPESEQSSEKMETLKEHLLQESVYATSSKSSSLFSKLWLFLNETAIEVPGKNSKPSS